MLHIDTVDKIVTRYFAVTARDPFVYKGEAFSPRPLLVSPLLLRGYLCPPGCGGCCLKFSLDYLPSERRPAGAAPRVVDFDGREVILYTDFQADNPERTCRHLEEVTGRCGIYQVRPFSCDFELIRPLVFSDATRPNALTQKLFGRGWSYRRVDGGKGALCEMTPADKESTAEVVRKLRRLEEWASHFGLRTWAGEIAALVSGGRLRHPVLLTDRRRKGLL